MTLLQVDPSTLKSNAWDHRLRRMSTAKFAVLDFACGIEFWSARTTVRVASYGPCTSRVLRGLVLTWGYGATWRGTDLALWYDAAWY